MEDAEKGTDVLDLVDLGGAMEETKQGSPAPVSPDSLFVWSWPF